MTFGPSASRSRPTGRSTSATGSTSRTRCTGRGASGGFVTVRAEHDRARADSADDARSAAIALSAAAGAGKVDEQLIASVLASRIGGRASTRGEHSARPIASSCWRSPAPIPSPLVRAAAMRRLSDPGRKGSFAQGARIGRSVHPAGGATWFAEFAQDGRDRCARRVKGSLG